MRQDQPKQGLADETSVALEVSRLAKRARDGDSAAVSALFTMYRSRVIRFCLSFASIGQADAHDITQEVFIRAFRGISRLRDPGSFQSWLFKIARRRCLTFFKRSKKRVEDHKRLAIEEQMRESKSVEAEKMKQLEKDIVAEEIERLPDSSMKTAGRMFYLEGQATSHIAEQMDAPISTVTTWLSRLRGKVRKRLVLRILALRGHEGGTV
ncbi:MAG: sigma-70 family RNA polymerase sigma factor [Deltaproteobacteria bacterium]|nr:sigma-70 family RNA polymerase sigma factor [Deltaproteobacteria bacterium]